MPFGDGTGPRGFGPRTGRGAGYCAGTGMPAFMSNVPGGAGFGFGRGRGMCWPGLGGGRGWRSWYRAAGLPRWSRAGYAYSDEPTLTAREEMSFLREEAEFLKKQLEEIQIRINNLEKTESREGS